MPEIVFSEENIQRIFGHEAAEDEEFDRLKEYYFKSKTYDKIKADLPLRILVGHKGIGKSALFKVAMAEDREDGRLPIFLRPNDIMGIQPATPAFLNRISDWKYALQAIVAQKSLDEFGITGEGKAAGTLSSAGRHSGFSRTRSGPIASPNST